MKQFILSCDLETTGTSAAGSDWITGSFAVLDYQSLQIIRELELKSRPRFWSDEAAAVHGISLKDAIKFPDRKDALAKLIEFLPPYRSFDFLCHARAQNESGYFHFDFAFLKYDFFDQLSIFEFRKYFNDRDVISTHTMAKELQARKVIPDEVSKGLSGLCAYFKIYLNHHDAKSDRRACELLYAKLRGLYDGSCDERGRDLELDPGVPKIQRTAGSPDQQRFGF